MDRRIAELSLAALRIAARAHWAEAPVLAGWLYRFGTVPRGPAIDRDFGPGDDPMAVLGMTVGGGARRLLESAYEVFAQPGWYSFARALVGAQVQAVCKLYVSPRPEAMADAFPRIVDVFVCTHVRSFKVGRGVEGLLRPDKIVAYFEDCAHMANVAALLCRRLQAYPVQGVPFTADAGGDGLVSSGVDPPAGDAAASWRSWVTKRLAASLTAHRGTSGVDPVAAALSDIRVAGVDPHRWLPAADLFRGSNQS